MAQPKNWNKAFVANSQDINQTVGIQVTIMLEIKLQKYIFRQIMSTFLAANVSFLNAFQDGDLHDYATIYKLTKKTLR